MADEKEVYWTSPVPEKCQTCHKAIEFIFYDARTSFGGWAIMCAMCFYIGPGLAKVGTGFGQKYERQRDGRWKKVGG